MVKQETIDRILGTVSQVDGSFGATLVSADGMVIASRLDKRFTEEKMAALTAASVHTAQKVIDEAGFGDADTMLIEGTEGKMCLIYNPKNGIFLCLLGDKTLNIGMARLALDEAMEALEQA